MVRLQLVGVKHNDPHIIVCVLADLDDWAHVPVTNQFRPVTLCLFAPLATPIFIAKV